MNIKTNPIEVQPTYVPVKIEIHLNTKDEYNTFISLISDMEFQVSGGKNNDFLKCLLNSLENPYKTLVF